MPCEIAQTLAEQGNRNVHPFKIVEIPQGPNDTNNPSKIQVMSGSINLGHGFQLAPNPLQSSLLGDDGGNHRQWRSSEIRLVEATGCAPAPTPVIAGDLYMVVAWWDKVPYVTYDSVAQLSNIKVVAFNTTGNVANIRNALDLEGLFNCWLIGYFRYCYDTGLGKKVITIDQYWNSDIPCRRPRPGQLFVTWDGPDSPETFKRCREGFYAVTTGHQDGTSCLHIVVPRDEEPWDNNDTDYWFLPDRSMFDNVKGDGCAAIPFGMAGKETPANIKACGCRYFHFGQIKGKANALTQRGNYVVNDWNGDIIVHKPNIPGSIYFCGLNATTVAVVPFRWFHASYAWGELVCTNPLCYNGLNDLNGPEVFSLDGLANGKIAVVMAEIRVVVGNKDDHRGLQGTAYPTTDIGSASINSIRGLIGKVKVKVKLGLDGTGFAIEELTGRINDNIAYWVTDWQHAPADVDENNQTDVPTIRFILGYIRKEILSDGSIGWFVEQHHSGGFTTFSNDMKFLG